MKYLFGTKEGMTQVFDEAGVARAATVLRVSPAVVSQVKTVERDGYNAVQIAAGEQKEHRVSRAERGRVGGAKRFVKEFRPRANWRESVEGIEQGATLDASAFEPGDVVVVSAISKGKGFQGVVKRHGFSGGPKTHGNKHHERAPGSIGIGGVQRVQKGLRMAGRMGGERVAVKNLKVLQVDPAAELILVSGAVPGRPGTLVEIRGINRA
jgi:large subunit ribosomal protein L3